MNELVNQLTLLLNIIYYLKMNKKLKLSRRKLNYLAKLYSHLEHKAKQKTFTLLLASSIGAYPPKEKSYITQEERRLLWSHLRQQAQWKHEQLHNELKAITEIEDPSLRD